MKRLLTILSPAVFLGISNVKAQVSSPIRKNYQTINISGSIVNASTKSDADTSVYVVAKFGVKMKTAYCNTNGQYSLEMPDTLNGYTVILKAMQDEKKIKQISTGEPCSTNCPATTIYINGYPRKIALDTNKAKNYTIDFQMTPLLACGYRFQTIYFMKNTTTMAQSDLSLFPDSAVCEVKNRMKCKKEIVVEISGRCRPEEIDKDTLSLKRAQTIGNKLIAMGINPKRIIIKGYSDKYFQEEEDWKKNKNYVEIRPAFINKKDYEGQTVDFSVLRIDFNE